MPISKSNRAEAKTLDERMAAATSYSDWLSAAEALDELTGEATWREDCESPEIAGDLIKADITALTDLERQGDLQALAARLHESVYRHQGDIGNPHLYAVAVAGTKHLIDDYLDSVASAIRCLVEVDDANVSATDKLQMLQNAQLNLGGPALMLSGGASMGFFHLGVVKALLEQGLLPKVLCGASIGSLIAGGVCARSDAELTELFTDLDEIYRFGIRFLKPLDIWQKRAVLDQDQLLRCAEENVGDLTFSEAAAKSGRYLCISVSPSRARQKPRVLSAISSPEVLVPNAVAASSAIPGLFPPVALQARNAAGEQLPYLPEERWVDGTFQSDLPTKRLGRLFNVNHFIVSQVNPHAIPFMVSRGSKGPMALAADFALSSARVQTAQALKVIQKRVRNDSLYHLLEHGRLMAEQDYRGDTCIHPPMSAWMYRRMISNPSVADLKQYIQMGERATWPQIALIRNQTRIQRKVAQAVKQLKANL